MTFIINQRAGHAASTKLDQKWFEQEVFSVADKRKQDFEVFELDLKELEAHVDDKIHSSKQLALAPAFNAFVQIGMSALEAAKKSAS